MLPELRFGQLTVCGLIAELLQLQGGRLNLVNRRLESIYIPINHDKQPWVFEDVVLDNPVQYYIDVSSLTENNEYEYSVTFCFGGRKMATFVFNFLTRYVVSFADLRAEAYMMVQHEVWDSLKINYTDDMNSEEVTSLFYNCLRRNFQA